jgi:hypothetical protein
LGIRGSEQERCHHQSDSRGNEQAQDIMGKVGAGRIELIELGHWLIEVAGVITRLSPQTVADDLILLHQIELGPFSPLPLVTPLRGVTNLPALCAVDVAQSAQGAVRYEPHWETIAGDQRARMPGRF